MKLIKSTLAVSTAVATLGFFAAGATAAGNGLDSAQNDWYRTAEDTVRTEPADDYQRAPADMRSDEGAGEFKRPNRRAKRGWNREGRGRGHRRGHRRIYERNLTKEQFFARQQRRFERLDVDGNGSINIADIENFLAERQEARGRGKRRGGFGRRRGDRLVRRMERLDQNADGKVTTDEFFGRVEQRFARLDRNNDGRLNKADMEN